MRLHGFEKACFTDKSNTYLLTENLRHLTSHLHRLRVQFDI
jgi:hypothetical protein